MTPDIYATCNTAAVRALLKTGAGELRLYAWGMAPQNVAKPYVVWQLVGGSPENYLGDAPDIDGSTVQVDVYAASSASARAVAEALRVEIEKAAYVTFVRGEGRDPATMNYTYGFDSDWFTAR